MPDGLKYLLAAPGKQRCVAILENELTCLNNADYVGELVKNFANENKRHTEVAKRQVIHLVLYLLPKESLSYDQNMTFVYDDFDMSIDTLFKEVSQNVNKHPYSSHILIIDDFSTFSLLSASRNCSIIQTFLKRCSRKVQRIFVFSNQNTLSTVEISKLYEVASAVAVLGSFHGALPNELLQSQRPVLVCDLLKIREERRVSHEQTRFQVAEGVITEFQEDAFASVVNKTQEDVLKNLTTFKLTVEDNEKESRSKLYLPYFDAQKITVDDPEDLDEYDDEDEEV